jgi:hypothetical protein
VFVASFAPVVFQGSACVPQTLTIAQQIFMDLQQQMDELKDEEQPSRAPRAPREKRKPVPVPVGRAAKKLKFGEGCSKITTFFALDARAVR